MRRYAAIAEGFEPIIVNGFNRRFAPHVRKMREFLATVHEPKVFVMMINAGEIPPDHWTQDPAVGGGRIVGQACHFVGLLRYLADSPICRARAVMIGEAPGMRIRGGKAMIILEISDGSFGCIHDLGNGHRSLSKERLEAFCGGRVLQLDDFCKLRGFGWPGFSRMRL